jgi:cyclophilin family peptidyl-prolyl cis-trans isomerase
MPNPSRRASWFKHKGLHRRHFRPLVQELEDRRLLAAPVLAPLDSTLALHVPAGKTLFLPLAATDPQGGSVSFNVTSSDPSVTPVPHTNNTFLQLTVAGFGTMEFELFNDLTPQTAALIAGFAKSQFYDGLTIHRVEPNFVIQGGDPLGNGTGGPGIDATHPTGYQFNDELKLGDIFSGSGQLALANAGSNTNGSQFFVTLGAQRFLDLRFTLFGQLVRGFDVLKAIDSVPIALNPDGQTHHPVTPIVITSAQIVKDPSVAVFTLQSTGSTAVSTNLTVTATSSTGGTSTETLPAQVVVDPSTSNDPPVFNPVPTDQVSTASTPITIHVTRSDLEDDAATFTATVVDANGNPTTANASAAVTNAQPGSADIVVTPTTGFTGSVRLKLTVADTTGSSVATAQIINVAFGDQPLSNATASPVTGLTEGTTSGSVTLGSFTDGTATAVPANYSVVINWGDGTPLDSTSAGVTGTGGSFTVSGTHTYSHAGTFPVKVTITDVHTSTAGGDNGGATATFTTTATVADAGLTVHVFPQTAVGGVALNNAVVALVTDTNTLDKATDLSATIDWGDGSTSVGTLQSLGSGHYQVLGSHTFKAGGSRALTVTVNDQVTSGDVPGASAQASAAATVSTKNQVFVQHAYLKLVGSQVPATLLNQWTAELDKGTSRVFVVKQIEKLPAFRTAEVRGLFQSLLEIPATAQQVRAGLTFLKRGGTFGQLKVRILSSPLFFSLKGGTNATFLAALGRILLHQSLSAAETARFTRELASGMSRAFVVEQVLHRHALRSQQVVVQNIYTTCLGRLPNSQETAAGVALLRRGDIGLLQLIAQLVGSTEFFDKLFAS